MFPPIWNSGKTATWTDESVYFSQVFLCKDMWESLLFSSLRLRNKCQANWPIKIIPNLSNRTGKQKQHGKLGIHHSLYATLFNGPTYCIWWNDLEYVNFELCCYRILSDIPLFPTVCSSDVNSSGGFLHSFLQPPFASSAVALPDLAMAEREAKRQKTEKDIKM